MTLCRRTSMGDTAPGAPNLLVNLGANRLNLGLPRSTGTPPQFDVHGDDDIPCARPRSLRSRNAFTGGTTQTIDGSPIGSCTDWRTATFGDHESMVVNHAVRQPAGIRWYELRDPGAPRSYQQGPLRPTQLSWMAASP